MVKSTLQVKLNHNIGCSRPIFPPFPLSRFHESVKAISALDTSFECSKKTWTRGSVVFISPVEFS